MTDPRGTVIRTQRGLFLLWQRVPGGMIVAPITGSNRPSGRLDLKIAGATETIACGLAAPDPTKKVWRSFLADFSRVFTLIDDIPRAVVGRAPAALIERAAAKLQRAAGSIATEDRQRMG